MIVTISVIYLKNFQWNQKSWVSMFTEMLMVSKDHYSVMELLQNLKLGQ